MITNDTCADQTSRLKEMEEENELLLLQLHTVQEELERYYLRNKELEAQAPASSLAQYSGNVCVDEELPSILAEKARLQAQVKAQQQVHRLEAENALNARLGKMLIDAVDAPGGLAALPGKLLGIWRQSRQLTPPEALGGKDFGKVISAFRQGGFEAAETLLAGQAISPAMQANAYTALARAIMKGDRSNAAQAARRAHALDPKPFRLKWLAFRLHEAGEVMEAEAMLDILPEDIAFSESEQRQASQLRHEAKWAREQAARKESRFDQRRSAMDQQIKALTRARDQQTQLADERGRELNGLKQAKAQLEQEKQALAGERDAQIKLAEARRRELDGLKQAKAALEHDKSALLAKQGELDRQLKKNAEDIAQTEEENQQLLHNLHMVQEQLEQQFLTRKEQAELAEERGRELDDLKEVKAQLEREKAVLAGWRDAQAKLLEARGRELDALKQTQAQLEQEKQVLAGERDAQAKLTEARGREFDALKQVQTQLEQEKQALAGERDVQAELLEARGREFDALKQVQTQLEQEKQALAGERDAQAKLLEARGRELDELKQAKAQLDRERQALAGERDAHAKLAAERLKQISELQQQLQSRQSNETELMTRQQMLQEEMARAEAQLDLIKELLLREPGL